MNIVDKYQKILEIAGLKKIKAEFILSLSLLLLGVGISLTLLLQDVRPFIVTAIAADIIVGYPYLVASKKLREVEEALPDALKQMASVLKAGGTFEVAIREVIASGYGELSRQFSRVLRDMEGGRSFHSALHLMAERIGLRSVERLAIIISDTVRVGGGVVDVLDDIAEDIRELLRIRRERVTKTTMQFMFLLILSSLLSPFLAGITIGLTDFMLFIGRQFTGLGVVGENVVEEKARALEDFKLVLTLFVIVQAILTPLAASIIRYGSITQGLLLVPVVMLIAYLSLLGGQSAVHLIMGLQG